jgi:hypothetical protein
MKPFEKMTLDACKATSSASLHIPSAKVLKNKLNAADSDKVGSLKDGLLEEIDTRMREAESVAVLSVATFLDPRFKAENFQHTNTKKEVILRLEADFAPEASTPEDPRQQSDPGVRSTSSEADEPPAKRPRTELSDMWCSIAKRKQAPQQSDILAEIRRYDNKSSEDLSVDVLKWWSANEARFPLLSSAARRYLSPPASSVDSERVFSACGNVFSDKRTRLSPTNLERLVFLSVNLRIMHGNY